MSVRQSVAEQIREIVRGSPGCRLDEIVRACPDFTWNQVFLEIDRLTRQGELILNLESPGVYTVRLSVPVLPQAVVSQAVATVA